MEKIKIIKTLRHLNSLFFNKKTTIYSEFFSYNLFKCIDSAELVAKNAITYQDFLKKINKIGLNRVETVNSIKEFSIKGDTITIWLPGYDSPIRIEFFGDEVESMYLFDNFSKGETLGFIIFTNYLTNLSEEIASLKIKLGENLKKANTLQKIIFVNKTIDTKDFFKNEAVEIIETDFVFPPLFFKNEAVKKLEINNLKSKGFKVIINQLEDLKLKFGKNDLLVGKENLKSLPAGFISNRNKIAYFTKRELLGTIDLKRVELGVKSKTLQKILRQFEGEISVGDYVVHEDYGIGIYAGFEQHELNKVLIDYLLIKFADEDELYIPIEHISKITKYLGGNPQVTKLGRKGWRDTKRKVKKTTLITAKNLLVHYSMREVSNAFKIGTKDSIKYKRFEDDFEYIETTDQKRSINEVLKDLGKDIPMNRLLVGDVGFGKTEVIMRACFKIAEKKKQIAFLAPTTILAAQHYDVFKNRFKNFPFTIEVVSRFNSSSKNKNIIEKVNKGEVDILIGTHRILSSDVKFKDLGLVVVDEEQKFGVKQKEKIKKLNYGTHVLSVSATPIPRSLNLALSTIQDISIMSTPPEGRKKIKTELIFKDWIKVSRAIQDEVSRGGQVFFIHNRINNIQAILNKLQTMLTQISFNYAHGRMTADNLDKIFTDFYYKKFDVLISTNIVENGLDLPNVNTIIIHDAHNFGLSQLYQLRGRVGRSNIQAYCYLMAPSPSKVILDSENNVLKSFEKTTEKNASEKLYMQRLQSLVDNQDLGAGFRLASKDLEIRGAGNILGEKQSGHINGVGYALYMEMLAESIEKVKSLSKDEIARYELI